MKSPLVLAHSSCPLSLADQISRGLSSARAMKRGAASCSGGGLSRPGRGPAALPHYPFSSFSLCPLVLLILQLLTQFHLQSDLQDPRSFFSSNMMGNNFTCCVRAPRPMTGSQSWLQRGTGPASVLGQGLGEFILTVLGQGEDPLVLTCFSA